MKDLPARAGLCLLAAGLAACQSTGIEPPTDRGNGVVAPSEPAAVGTLVENAEQPPWQPARVALLIPLQGPLAAAGRSVRDGFIAAYLHGEEAAKPGLRIYDSVASPMPALHQQCLADGIELIVGPLSKENLAALRDLNVEVPVLGLNYLDEVQAPIGGKPESDRRRPGIGEDQLGFADAPIGGKPRRRGAAEALQRAGERNGGWPLEGRRAMAEDALTAGRDFGQGLAFRQLGLAIEDEAASIAERLRRDGIERLLVVRNDEDWAVRGSRALVANWPFNVQLQGFADAKTITESVGEAMQASASLERRDALQKLLDQNLKFQPRTRTDLDGVVAFVNHLEAAALAPALRYHAADRLPVYASSQSVRNPSALEELNGFQIAEMPFQMNADELSRAVRQAFGLGSGNVAAFYALGIDAWRILKRWRQMAGGQPIQGATGTLQLGADGRIRRQLAWGAIAGGAIRPLAAANP